MENKKIFKTREGRELPVSLETITPEIAKAYLETSPGNRATKAHTLAAYVRDFEAGNWKLTSATICFDEDGKLMDGHHRLMACIKSGVPFETLVVKLPRETVIAIDKGVGRTIADTFRYAGVEKNQALKSSTVRRVLQMSDPTAESKRKYSDAEMIREYEAHKDVYDYSTDYAREVFNSYKQLAPSVIAGFVAFLIINKDCPKEKVESFFDQMAHYRSQSKTIETIMTKLALVTPMKTRNVSLMKWIILVRGWNAWIKGNNNLANITYTYERDKNIQPVM